MAAHGNGGLSGVQRVLDARGQRGSLMSTNKKKFFYQFISQKISGDLFLAHSPIFFILTKLLWDAPLSWMPGAVPFSLIFKIF